MDKSIKIDEETQKELLQTNALINELQAKVQLICSTYVRALGKTGKNYSLNQECSELIENK